MAWIETVAPEQLNEALSGIRRSEEAVSNLAFVPNCATNPKMSTHRIQTRLTVSLTRELAERVHAAAREGWERPGQFARRALAKAVAEAFAAERKPPPAKSGDSQ